MCVCQVITFALEIKELIHHLAFTLPGVQKCVGPMSIKVIVSKEFGASQGFLRSVLQASWHSQNQDLKSQVMLSVPYLNCSFQKPSEFPLVSHAKLNPGPFIE